MLDACVASAIDEFLTSLDATPTSTFDYASIESEINSIASGLTSFGVTVSSIVPDPATFTGAESYSGPYVSDIISSYSEYAATHTSSGGSLFSFDTTSFQATARTSEGTYLLDSNEMVDECCANHLCSETLSTSATAESTTTSAAIGSTTTGTPSAEATIADFTSEALMIGRLTLVHLLAGLWVALLGLWFL